MKLIYIAGPYRANCEYEVKRNIDEAEKAALWVWGHGGAAICPHKNTAFLGGALGIEDKTWLVGDLEILKRCDAVYAMAGWRRSQGATAEVEFARRQGIPVFEQLSHEGLLLEFLEENA